MGEFMRSRLLRAQTSLIRARLPKEILYEQTLFSGRVMARKMKSGLKGSITGSAWKDVHVNIKAQRMSVFLVQGAFKPFGSSEAFAGIEETV